MTEVDLNTNPAAWRIAVRAAFVVLGLAAWFGTQAMIGAREPSSTPQELKAAGEALARGDAVLSATGDWHARLWEDRTAAHALLIASSLVIDALGLFLLGWAVFGASLRPFMGLLLLFGLRQISQALVALPAPAGIIWEDPGFPSLLVTYSVANDFFFSGHTALAVYGCVELGRFGGKKLWIPCLAVAVFQALSVLVLRAHYTLDVLAGALAALLAAELSVRIAPPVDRALDRWLLRRDPTTPPHEA
jgi:membrane-associated phospholipid phosphatase